jgi:hypothetical protein
MSSCKCPVCGSDATCHGQDPQSRRMAKWYQCQQCGEYLMTLDAEGELGRRSPDDRQRVSTVLREFSDKGTPVYLHHNPPVNRQPGDYTIEEVLTLSRQSRG